MKRMTADLEDLRRNLLREAERVRNQLDTEFYLPSARRRLEQKLQRLGGEIERITLELDEHSGQQPLF
jgi:hypothetical protein